MYRQLNFQRGLTLLDIMVSLALSALLMMSVVNIFHTVKKSLDAQSALVDILIKGELAAWTLSYDSELSGYFGCITQSLGDSLLNHTEILINQETVFEIIDNKIHVQYLESIGKVTALAAGKTKILYEGGGSINPGDIVGVINCEGGELVGVSKTNVEKFSITLNEALVNDYNGHAMVGKLVDRFYSVEHAALFVKNYNAQAQELIEGVEAMNIITENENWPAMKNIKLDLVLKGFTRQNLSIVKKWRMTLPLRQRM